MTLDCLAAPDAATLPLHCVAPADLAALRARLAPEAAGFLDASGFAARAQDLRLLPGGTGIAGAVLGLGEGEVTPWAFGGLSQALPSGSAWHLADPAPGPEAALGWCLGAYRYSRFKAPGRAPAQLRPPAGAGRALQAAEAAWRVRDLINAPANHLGPAELAQAVQDLATMHGARCRILDGVALQEGFPALAAVGQASIRAPRVAMLEWGAPGAPLVALCGKGVCFDSGGLDLKPASGMLRMKKDMGGAAILLGVAEMVMRAGLPVRLLLLVGAVENAVAGNAFRPGDVLRTRAGLTVEVGNTDAEGRLVLADLLAFAAEHDPALILDAATLTGAARTALGPDLPALFTPQDSLAATLLEAGEQGHDPVWRLPLHAGYDAWLDSAVADINNVSTRTMAGAIIGGLFLRRFVPTGTAWAHMDVYAWNDGSRPGRPEGGEAQGMRAIFGAIENMFGGRPGPGR
ncbi:leucyl aminopeptidase family protein [Paracraurococcus ruber]|uniref:Leucyl aminopeptidase n=1 Tax=Paracraurococcus ruber TaxID=77675 RepID=A0ABS1CR67_9PROT|nr:leucyl aminopeptidase family protein [Paracraurococcus ruber]MBK1656937.1 leucyl aminopeptidase [Paracraurococcus ruber]TDG34268.1 leucyl aminopeptidase family protein [Paracraurococcus ruber]